LKKHSRLVEKINELLELSQSFTLSSEQVFNLYQSYGFPIELTEEIAAEKDFLLIKKQ